MDRKYGLLFCKGVLFFLLLAYVPSLNGQQNLSLSDYIETYKDIAMEEMRNHGIPASIKLGQGILESGFGNSDLAVIGNNHFGIKCHGWQGRTFYKDDDEVNECFRAYDDPLQSFRDHSEFLTGRPRYAALFDLDITDYKGWARGLSRAGYATNPRYPQLLIGIIERNSLYEFDRIVVEDGYIAERSRQRGRKATAPASSASGGEDFPEISVGRQVRENNRIRFVYAKRGDTPESIAEEMGLWTWEIVRYNDLERGQRINEGDVVYLQPKRRNANQKYHVVQQGETMAEISQKYGVRLRLLYRRNDIEPGEEPAPGQQLRLRSRFLW